MRLETAMRKRMNEHYVLCDRTKHLVVDLIKQNEDIDILPSEISLQFMPETNKFIACIVYVSRKIKLDIVYIADDDTFVYDYGWRIVGDGYFKSLVDACVYLEKTR